MKKATQLLLPFLFLLFSANLFAQDIKWSAEEKTRMPSALLNATTQNTYKQSFDLAGSDEKHVYYLQKWTTGGKKDEFRFKKYEKNTLKLVADEELDIPGKGYSLYEVFLIRLGNKNYLIYPEENSKAKRVTIYAQELTDEGKNKGARKSISQKKTGGGSFSLSCSISENKNWLLLYNRYASAKEDILITSFNSDLEVVSDFEDNVNISDEKIGIQNAHISDAGSAYVTIWNLPKKQEPEQYMLVMNSQNNEQNLLQLNSAGSLVDYSIVSNGDNAIVLGFFSEETGSKKAGIQWAFMELSANGNVVNQKTYPFSNEVLTAYTKEKAKISDLNIGEAKADGNGNLYVVMEHVDLWGGQQSAGPCFMNHLAVVQFNVSGELNWQKLVPKSQKFSSATTDFMYYSYTPAISNGEFFLVYNDDIKNKNAYSVKDIKKCGNYKKSGLTVVHVSPEGKVKKKIAYDTKEGKLAVLTSSSGDDESGNLYFIAVKDNFMKVGELSLTN